MVVHHVDAHPAAAARAQVVFQQGRAPPAHAAALGGAVQDEQGEIGLHAAPHIGGSHRRAALTFGDEEGGKARPGHLLQFR